MSENSFNLNSRSRKRNILKGHNSTLDTYEYGYRTQCKAGDYHIVNGKVGLDRTSFYI